MNLAIIQYNAGNIQSLTFALERLGIEPVITNDRETLLKADKIIFPGVGEASSCMRNLKSTGLHTLIPDLEQPFLGICLGMQLMCTYSEENDTECLGIFSAKVKKFDPTEYQLKVPHMGWNTIVDRKTQLFKDIKDDAFTYFVHSYYVEETEETIAISHYGDAFSAAIQKNNFYATQFHPEKSSVTGAKILENFLSI